MWKQRQRLLSLFYTSLRSSGKRSRFFSSAAAPVSGSPSFRTQRPFAVASRRFGTEAAKPAVAALSPVAGEMVDEVTDIKRPELYAVPITPPNLSISGKDIGLKPMSLEDFRKKISSFQNSDRWKEFNTDEGVIENERADILADRINELLSNRKQKFIYKELQRFIMLPSPVDRQALIKMLRTIDKGLDEVSPSILPWIEAYFNGTEFPEAGEELREVQLQLNALTKVTEKFFRDWENVQYDGFQWRVNVVRDCIESYVTDEESSKLYAYFNAFAESPKKAASLTQFLTRCGTILKFNQHSSDLLALIEWVIKGLNDFPLISISAIQSTEARRRDAERHTLICAYNKYRYHSKMLVRSDEEQEKGALLLSFRLSTLLSDAQHKLFVARLADYQASPMGPNDLQAFVRAACQICGQSAYLVQPSLKQYANFLSIPTLEHVRRMKKPVLTVKAVTRFCNPDGPVEQLLAAEPLQDGKASSTAGSGAGNTGEGTASTAGTGEGTATTAEKPLKKRQRVLTFQSNAALPGKHANANSFYQVFVHNLPAGIGTEELARAFRNCGSVSKVEILDYSRPEEAEKKRVPRIRQQTSESRIYGFIHFTEREAREKALIPAMRVFGVKIRDCLCRTGEPAENKRTLFVGNIDKGVTGEEVSESLNQILKPQLQIELQNVSPPGILTTSAGYCFIEFDSHQLASSCFSLLSGAVVNGKELKVGWALDSNDMRRRKQEYKWDKYHF